MATEQVRALESLETLSMSSAVKGGLKNRTLREHRRRGTVIEPTIHTPWMYRAPC